MNRSVRANLLLTMTALIWGAAFVAQDVAADTLGAFTFNGLRMALEPTPFAGMQNLPLRTYGGELAGAALLRAAGLQVFWLAALVALGVSLMRAALRRVVVQGG